MQMIVLATVLLCTTVPAKPLKVGAKPSPEATFKQRWLALHFRELAR